MPSSAMQHKILVLVAERGFKNSSDEILILSKSFTGLAGSRNVGTSTSVSSLMRFVPTGSARTSRATSSASATQATLLMNQGETARTSMNARTLSPAYMENAATRRVGSSAAAHKASNCLTVDMAAWTEGRGLAMHTSTRQPAVLSADVG